MDFNNFTLKAQEAIQKAQELAQGLKNPSVEPDHLLKGMFMVDEHVIPYLLKKINVNPVAVTAVLDRMI